jgi:hypothetical protein
MSGAPSGGAGAGLPGHGANGAREFDSRQHRERGGCRFALREPVGGMRTRSSCEYKDRTLNRIKSHVVGPSGDSFPRRPWMLRPERIPSNSTGPAHPPRGWSRAFRATYTSGASDVRRASGIAVTPLDAFFPDRFADDERTRLLRPILGSLGIARPGMSAGGGPSGVGLGAFDDS